MTNRLLRGLTVFLIGAAIVALYVGLAFAGATVVELVVVTSLVLLAAALLTLTLHIRALHRALFQQAQVAYKAFMLDFFFSVRGLLRDRRESSAVDDDLIWNMVEVYFRREAELYNTVVEELYDKTSMMHLMERGRVRKDAGIPDPRPVEPLYAELHELLARLREERQARRPTDGQPVVAGPTPRT